MSGEDARCLPLIVLLSLWEHGLMFTGCWGLGFICVWWHTTFGSVKGLSDSWCASPMRCPVAGRRGSVRRDRQQELRHINLGRFQLGKLHRREKACIASVWFLAYAQSPGHRAQPLGGAGLCTGFYFVAARCKWRTQGARLSMCIACWSACVCGGLRKQCPARMAHAYKEAEACGHIQYPCIG